MAKKVPAAENQTLRQFGTELARLRSLSETSQRTVAGHTQISPQLAGAIERGERYPSLEFSQKADELLNGGGLLASLWRKMQNDAYPHFIGELVDVEPLASLVRTYQPQLVPGLLQTESYVQATLTARAVSKSGL
ncbi:Scr1 family TA system antitoxin-like transcriptional regulator [Nocardiopsis salina]|uniref:Scr1 family TA system antitoxin-like transcriptional regulator n=1 Tax=Nocardiopsis salina TaxID=245836 RepID=UPI001EF9FD04|nr:Scr1 family TA system antitoxin-like transcriptional regulator [Nocardiopsis salina]